MGLFRLKRQPGWVVVSRADDGLCFAQVVPNPAGKAVVQRLKVLNKGLETPADLKKLAKDMNCAGQPFILVLRRDDYRMYLVAEPKVADNELKNALRFPLKELLDYRVEQATLDFLRIPREKGMTSKNASVFAVAAPNELIRNTMRMFEAAKLNLKAIDIIETAQRNIAARLEETGKVLAMLAFNEEGGLLTLTYKGELYQARWIEVSTGQLAADSQAKALFEKVALEVQRSLDQYERQFSFAMPNRLVLLNNPQATALRDYLADNLDMPVEVVELRQVFDMAPGPEVEPTTDNFQVLGAGLREE